MKKVLCILCCFFLVSCAAETKNEDKKEEKKKDEIVDVSFSAVGDNLVHGAIYYYNNIGNGKYNFDDIYQNTNYLTNTADVSYINLETICAGTELELSSYPTFNGPLEVLDALHNAGFDWLSGASNHTFDRGEAGILKEIEYIKNTYPQMLLTGVHENVTMANKSTVLKKNGLNIGILDYTYGLNGFTLPIGKEYLVDLIDKDKIKKDMEKLNEVSDVQIVSMHWGEEYQFEPNDVQKDLAQYLSDLGVDVIIGTHPHVIQPMDYVEGKEGNKTLVMYSLGNFMSAQDENYRMLGGMAKWNIKFNKKTKEVNFKNVKFIPTIMHIEGNFNFFRTYALKDYTDELASKHTLLVQKGQDVSKKYFMDLVDKVMNDNVTIEY